MPKGDRRSLHNTGAYYLQSPVTSTQPYSDYYTVPLQTMSQSPYTQPQHHQHQQSYSTGGPVQPITQSQSQIYTMPPSAPLQPVQSPLTSLRPSSGAWTPADDQTLMQARSAGMNWGPIKQMYFPLKTPNACRKRHERLMEKRNADDWDGMKLEGLARSYMGMRREIWAGLAEATGEKWNVVEQKCMSQGIKNLQTAARASTRRERLSTNHHSHPSHPSPSYPPNYPPYSSSIRDDSGIEIEDLESGDYNDGSSDRSSYGGYGHTHSNSGGSGVGGGSQNGYAVNGGQMGGHGHGGHGGRLPSMDMGIDAIINRPRQ